MLDIGTLVIFRRREQKNIGQPQLTSELPIRFLQIPYNKPVTWKGYTSQFSAANFF